MLSFDQGVIEVISALAKKVASIFVTRGISTEADQDIYIYACEIMISTLLNILVSLVISLAFGQLLEGIVFIICFALLRHHTGGHHAEYHWGCILTFSIILLISLRIIEIAPSNIYAELSIIVATLAFVFISLTAPIEHRNKTISSNRRKILKKKSILIATFLCLTVLIGNKLTQSTVFLSMALSMASVSSSIAYAMLIKKGVDHYESGQGKE